MCLDNIVKATNDMLIAHKGKIMLGLRNGTSLTPRLIRSCQPVCWFAVFPQRWWWFGCGGKYSPGETRVEASRRLMKRELNLVLGPESGSRIRTVGE